MTAPSSASSTSAPASAPPVFFLHKEAPDDISVDEICKAAERISGFKSVFGAQRLGSLWRLYPTNKEARAKLANAKLLIRNKCISLCSQNPLAMRDAQGNEVPTTKLIIDGVPVSVSAQVLMDHITEVGYKPRSSLQWEMARNSEGQLTRFATGRRFVWIDLPSSSLPSMVKIPPRWQARLYYRERPKPTLTCFQCGLEGHRKGSPICQVTIREKPESHSSQEDAVSDCESEVSRASSESQEDMFSEACEDTVIENVESNTDSISSDYDNCNSENLSDQKTTNNAGQKQVDQVVTDSEAPPNIQQAPQPNKTAGRRGRPTKKKERDERSVPNSEVSNRTHKSKKSNVQSTLSSIFQTDNRSSSRKRTGPPSPDTPASAAQRPKL